MRLNRRFMKMLATTLSLLMLFTSFSMTSTAQAGLFSKIKDTVKANPGKTALATVAVGAGAIIAAPHIAAMFGLAAGAASAGTAGAVATVAGAGAGILGVGTAIWGGITAAGGFVTGALGAVGAAIGGMFSGIAGFVAGIVGSPLFIPALVVIGAAVVGYILWKKYKRQTQTIGNGSDLPTTTVGVPSKEVVPNSSSVAGEVTPISSEVTPTPAVSQPVSVTPPAPSAEVTPAVGTVAASDELKSAHADYIKAYNTYINLVTNIGGSENPDEEMRTNMRRQDVQTALTSYRDSYNKYLNLLRQSNSK
ncbi:MAG: hypothetical protein HQM09_23940 [Candidatus Riflebacteria bacterium]|nr:hypothetical protein [Candidatus Riflebacteria bacterium]